MRWPWTSRAEEAEEAAEKARKRLDRVEGQRPLVHAVTGETRRQGEMNGFSGLIIATIRKE